MIRARTNMIAKLDEYGFDVEKITEVVPDELLAEILRVLERKDDDEFLEDWLDDGCP